MIPREHPCSDLTYDKTTPDDPYHTNQPLTVVFEDLTSYKNQRNGAIAGKTGDVQFHDFLTADNYLAGIEFEETSSVKGNNKAGVYGGVVVGKTSNDDDLLYGYSPMTDKNPHGIISPRTDFFTISGVTFVEFNWNDAAALGDCSHCFHGASTDSGARTTWTEGLSFENVSKRIKHQFPYSGIYNDLDGTLTDLGADSYASYWYPHLDQDGCTAESVLYDGVICDSSAPLRRMAMYSMSPAARFRSMVMYILRYDDDLIAAKDDLEAYIDDKDEYSAME